MGSKDFTYLINPCGTVSGSKCSGSNIAVCQEWIGGSKVLGSADYRTITQVNGGVDIRVSGGAPSSACYGEPNKAEFVITCNRDASPYFTFDHYESKTCTWVFKSMASSVCESLPPPPPSPSSPSPPSPPSPLLWQGVYKIGDGYACNTTACCCPRPGGTVIVGESVDSSGTPNIVMEALSVGACASSSALWTAKGQLASKNSVSASLTFTSAVSPAQGTASLINHQLTVVQQSIDQCYFTARVGLTTTSATTSPITSGATTSPISSTTAATTGSTTGTTSK